MNPDPDVAQHQRNGHEQQSQARIPRAGLDSGFVHLTVGSLDGKSFPIEFSNFSPCAANFADGVQQLLATVLPRLFVQVVFARHADVDCQLGLLSLAVRMILNADAGDTAAGWMVKETSKPCTTFSLIFEISRITIRASGTMTSMFTTKYQVS